MSVLACSDALMKYLCARRFLKTLILAEWATYVDWRQQSSQRNYDSDGPPKTTVWPIRYVFGHVPGESSNEIPGPILDAYRIIRLQEQSNLLL